MERRTRKGVPPSVVRALQLDAVASEWLRSLRATHKGDSVVPVSPEQVRFSETIHAAASAPAVLTPLHEWSGTACHHVRHMCSFCRATIPTGDAAHIHFNSTLTAPFVLMCAVCADKMN